MPAARAAAQASPERARADSAAARPRTWPTCRSWPTRTAVPGNRSLRSHSDARLTTTNVVPQIRATMASTRSACQRCGDFFLAASLPAALTRVRYQNRWPAGPALQAPLEAAGFAEALVRGPPADTIPVSCEPRRPDRLLRSRSPEVPWKAGHSHRSKRNRHGSECSDMHRPPESFEADRDCSGSLPPGTGTEFLDLGDVRRLAVAERFSRSRPRSTAEVSREDNSSRMAGSSERRSSLARALEGIELILLPPSRIPKL